MITSPIRHSARHQQKIFFIFKKETSRYFDEKILNDAQRPSKINVVNTQIVNWKEDFGKQALQLTGHILIA